MITENLGEIITAAEEYDSFKYIVTKNEEGNYQVLVLNYPEITLSWRFDESDEAHRSMCESSMYYAIKNYKESK